MKKREITISTGNIHDPVLEDKMQKRDGELKDLARKNARHFAKRNLPPPNGDNLAQYTGEIKAGYEKLATEVFHHLQPAAHFPEAKMDADYYREKDGELGTAIKSREDQNRNDEYDQSDFNQKSIPSRIWIALVSTLIITLGEILFNTKAFQITGENLLFALILSICISIAVFLFAHITPHLYKRARTRIQRYIVVIGSLSFVTGLFIALAIFRSSYLALHEVHVNPTYFVIINLFFFIVSALLSFFVLPNWDEIKQNAHRLKTHQAMKRRNREIEQMKKEKDEIKKVILERTKIRMRNAHYANYAANRIRKMYWESLEAFKTDNLTHRTDGLTPECFNEILQEPDIDECSYTLIASNALEE